MVHFFQQHLDYVYFVYGLAFVLLAAICAVVPKEAARGAPWTWLGLFGLVHGVGEWLEMFAVTLHDAPAFHAVRLAIMALSFVFLCEFGRRSLLNLNGKGPGSWIHVLLLALAASGSLGGAANLQATARYALALTGGLWAASALYRMGTEDERGHRLLSVAAFGLAAYAVAAGVIVPQAPFFPASVLNEDWFFSAVGVPIQLFRGVLAVLVGAALWSYTGRARRIELSEAVSKTVAPFGFHLALMLAITLAAGWRFAEFASEWSDGEVRDNLLVQAGTATAGLLPARIAYMSGTAVDREDANYQRLRDQLQAVSRANPKVRSERLLIRRDGKILEGVIVDVEDPNRFETGVPYESPPKELLETFSSGKATTVGPYRTGSGDVVSAFAAIRDPRTNNVAGVLVIDISADDWKYSVGEYRLAAIFITLLVSLMIILFFILRERMWESSVLTAENERQLADAQRMARIGSWTYDQQTKRSTWSEEMYRIFGRDPNLGPPSFPDDYRPWVHPDDWSAFEAAVRKGSRGGEPYELEFRLVQPDGSLRHVVSRSHARRRSDSKALVMAGTLQEVTERRRMEEVLRRNEERYRVVASYTLDWEYWRALDGSFRFISPSCEQITGYRPEEFTADPDILVRMIHPDDHDMVVTHMRDSDQSHDAFELDYRIVRRDGEVRWLAHVCRAVYGDDGKHLGRRVSNRDITEKKRAAQELKELSLSDELTGLNNRRGFMMLARQQLMVAERLKQKLVLVYADMDGLKWINDHLGHKEGDRAIIDIANVLKSSFRSADILARIGGDEFVGLAIESSDNATELILARLKENINARNLRGDRPYKVSLSFGLTHYDADSPCSLDELLARGDSLMYANKQQKRVQRST